MQVRKQISCFSEKENMNKTLANPKYAREPVKVERVTGENAQRLKRAEDMRKQ